MRRLRFTIRARSALTWFCRAGIFSTSAATMLVAPRANAQLVDTNPPLPNVLILLDTAGSMERMMDGTNAEDAVNNPSGLTGARCNTTGAAVTPNRWGTAVQALTGDLGTYSCVGMRRSDAAFINEFTLSGQQPADTNYYLDWHRLAQPIAGDASHVCVIGHDQGSTGWPATASPSPPRVNLDFDAARIQGYKYSPSTQTYGTTASDACTFLQKTNGALDAAADLVRFGLMTYDNDTGAATGVSVVSASPLSFTQATNPATGMWSYFHGWDGSTSSMPTHGRPGGCVDDPVFELGARNPAAPPWEGRMIQFADPSTPSQVAIVNAQVQKTILATRPYGANPIGAMMDDAKWYFWGDASGPKNDAFVTGGCRKQYIILFTHAKPNQDLQSYCQGLGPPLGKCPYDYPENIAYGLAHGAYTQARGLVPNVQSEDLAGPGGQVVQTFVLGFSMSTFTKPNGQPGSCTDVINSSDGSLNTTICNDPTLQATYGACCTLEKIAINGGTGKAYFADDRASLDASLGTILGTIVNSASTRTPPVASPNVTGTIGASGGSSSAVFLSSFTAAANGVPWSGNVQRERLQCTFQSGSYQPQLQAIDSSKGDDFAANMDQDHTTQRHVLLVQPFSGTGFPTPQASATLRPYMKGPGSPSPSGDGFDNLGMYDGTEYEYDYTVTSSSSPVTLTEITPGALGIAGNCPVSVPGSGPPATLFGNNDCAQIAFAFALGMQSGPTTWPTAVKPFPARFRQSSDLFTHSSFGDVFHSTPAVVAPPSALLRDDSYQSFVSNYTTLYHSNGDGKPRRTVLYVATNDGLLHAFGTDYSVTDTSTFNSLKNNELWSLIPPAAMPNLIRNFPSAHNILLDGPPVVKDTVYQRTAPTSAADWHTTLVAGFGGGGPGYYAVDVTDPEVTTRGAHSFAPGHASTNSGTTAYAAKTGPHFLWQITDASLFGESSATPALTTVFANPGDGAVREIGVAILPGGGTTLQSGACPRSPNTSLTGTTQKKTLATPTAAGYAPNLTVRSWASGGCLAPVRGRSLNVVRLDTGEVIRSFMRADAAYEPMTEAPAALLTANSGANGTNTAGYKYIGRVIDTPLDSPMTGTPLVYPNDVGAIGQKIFVSDADGTMWRFDISNSDPNQWFGEIYLDAFNANAAAAAGKSSDPSFPTLGRSPIGVTPIIATGRDGNLTVEFGTGDQNQIGAVNTYPNFVYATSESVQTDSTTSVTKLRAQVNWYMPLLTGEMITGPAAVFDGAFYFASFAPPTVGGAACGGGTPRLWGMDFVTKSDTADPSKGGLARLTDPTSPATPPAQFANQPGTAIIPGIIVSASLSCATAGSAANDEYVPNATHSSTGNIAPSTYSLMAQVGAPGGNSGVVQTISRTLTSPRTSTIVDSWASIVE